MWCVCVCVMTGHFRAQRGECARHMGWTRLFRFGFHLSPYVLCLDVLDALC